MPEKIDQINKLNKLIKALPLPKKGLYKLKDNINLDDYIAILQSKRENKTYTIDASELGGSGTGIQSLAAGTNITIDDTDPQNPIISATGGGSPAGSNNQIQINQSGAFFADSTFQKSDDSFNLGLDHTQQSAVTFTGSGLDGMNVAGSGYSGTTFPNTYTVQITQNNAQLWTIVNINPGVFTPGEILTGVTSGETATFIGYAGIYDDVIIVSSVSGTFSSSEDIIGSISSVTQQFNFTYSTNCDAFTLTTSTGSSLGCTNSGSYDFGMGLDGVYPQFTSFSGYTIGDSWTWTYSTVNQNVLDFSNNDYKFQSTFGTDTFGYQIYDNLLGYGITGAVNSWSNSSDFALSGLFDAEDGFGHNTLFIYGDGTDNKISLLKNSVVLQLNNSSSQKGSLIFSNISFALTNNTSSGNRNGIIFNESNSGLLQIGNLANGNNTKITIDDVNEQITISNLPAYDDDTAAGVGGLTAGMVYMTTGSGSAPLNAAGILMIKQ